MCILTLTRILIRQPGFCVYYNAYENIDLPACLLCVYFDAYENIDLPVCFFCVYFSAYQNIDLSAFFFACILALTIILICQPGFRCVL